MSNSWRKIYDLPQSVNPWKNGVPNFALYLDIEPTNYCNYKCKFCVGQQQGKRSRGYMEKDLYLKICKQAKEYDCKGFRFLRWGEPLLHPDMMWMIKTAKKYGMLTHMTTNGHLLEHKYKELIDSGLDSIIVSLQGLSSDEYGKLRNGDFQKIMRGIDKLRGYKKKNPWITISTTVTDEKKEDIAAFKKELEKIVDEVSIGYTWFKRLENKKPVKDLIKRAKKLPHKFKCQEVMVKLSIDWDGAISPCCLDYDQQLTVGNIEKDDLMDMWKSKEVIAIRDLLSSKKQDKFVLCSTCELNHSFRGRV